MTYDGEKWKAYSYNYGSPADMTVAPDGDVWLIGNNNEIYRFDGNQWTELTWPSSSDLTPSPIVVAPDGAMTFFGSNVWGRYMP